jgi:hypothetical protein
MSEAACDDIEEHQDLSNEGLFIDMKQLFAASRDRRTLLLWKFTFVIEVHFEVHFRYGRSLLLWKFTFVVEVHFCYEGTYLLRKHTFVTIN